MRRPLKLKPAGIMVSRPCALCPFRRDVAPFLSPARVEEIWEAARWGTHFVCHETVNYEAPEAMPKPEHRRACAGMLLVARNSGLAEGLQIVQLAERLAGVTLDHLRGKACVWPSHMAMIEAHLLAFPPK